MTKKKNYSAEQPVVVDLFCGVGGLTYGLKQSGLRIAAGIDLDPSCEYPFEANTKARFLRRDISDIDCDELNALYGNAKKRVLAGCAPCQPFSTYSQSRRSTDDRWKLLKEFQRLATTSLPDVVTMENVEGLATQQIWGSFVRSLKKAGYFVTWRVIKCEEFGIPQTRRRLVLLASRHGDIVIENKTNFRIKTVRDVISNLPLVKAGEKNSQDPLHAAAGLSDLNVKRIKASTPGGTWREWPEEIRAKCHLRASGRTYPSVYGRMEWDKPAPTITTQSYGYGNGRFGHPEQNRAITLREAAIIQSFPKKYKFIQNNEEVSFQKIGTLIGNAVPPKLGKAIGKTIHDHLCG